MSTEKRRSPTPKDLREFGLLMATFLVLIPGLFFPWMRGADFPLWPWMLALPFASLGMVAPTTLAPVYHPWMRFARALGWFNARLLLSIVFFIVITPMSLAMRLLGRDPVHRHFDATTPSYRVPQRPTPREKMEAPF